MAPRDFLAAAVNLYQNLGATRIELSAAGGVDVARRITSGEPADIVVLARDAIDKLTRDGFLSAEGSVDVMKSGIAVAIRAGAARPSIADAASVRRALLNASTIGFSTGPSGKYLEALFTTWQLHEKLRPRFVTPPPGIPVAQLIASGQVELGFQQLSELLAAPGIEVLGPLPEEIQHLTTFTAGIPLTCSDRIAAQEFLRFLSAREARQLMHRHGMTATG